MVKQFLLFTLVCLGCRFVTADDEPQPQPSSALRTLIDDSVHWYEVRKSADSASMKPVVVMRWPNNLRGSVDGATVVWLADGRPEAIAAIYPWSGNLCIDFDSLSRGPLVATRGGRVVWSPKQAGLEFHAVADRPAPATARPASLRQMKAIAGQFTCTLLGWNADDSEREELRLVPSPLYRYEIDQPKGILDGALFSFATGTDPEAILVIEAVRVEGKSQWQYALVRNTSAKLEARLRNDLVWTAARYPEQRDPRGIHIQFTRPLDELLPAENETQSGTSESR